MSYSERCSLLRAHEGRIVEAIWDHNQELDWIVVCGRVIDCPPVALNGEATAPGSLALEAPDGRWFPDDDLREVRREFDAWPVGPLARWFHPSYSEYDDRDPETLLYGPPSWHLDPGFYEDRIVTCLLAHGSDYSDPYCYIWITGQVIATAPDGASAELSDAIRSGTQLCLMSPDGRYFASDRLRVSQMHDNWPRRDRWAIWNYPLKSPRDQDAEVLTYGCLGDNDHFE